MNLNPENVMCLFPPNTKIIDFNGTADKYTALVRSKCKTKEEFRRDWLTPYEKLSRVSLRVLVTRPSVGKIVVYKAAFRCQHNTYPRSHRRVKFPHKKHTGCKAVVNVTIKAPTENRRVRSKDAFRAEYPTEISIKHHHNHHVPPNTFLYNETHRSHEDSIDNPFLGYKVFMESSVENEVKSELVEPQERLDWSDLRDRWNLLFQKWNLSNSEPLYRALVRATTCMEGFETVNGTISALNALGRKMRTKDCEKNIILQPASLMEPKFYCDGIKIENDEIHNLEVRNEVDELLVIDHGWIT